MNLGRTKDKAAALGTRAHPSVVSPSFSVVRPVVSLHAHPFLTPEIPL